MGCTLPAIGDLWKLGAGVVPSYFCRRQGETNVRFRLTFSGQEAPSEYSASPEDELSIFGLVVAGVVRRTAGSPVKINVASPIVALLLKAPPPHVQKN